MEEVYFTKEEIKKIEEFIYNKDSKEPLDLGRKLNTAEVRLILELMSHEIESLLSDIDGAKNTIRERIAMAHERSIKNEEKRQENAGESKLPDVPVRAFIELLEKFIKTRRDNQILKTVIVSLVVSLLFTITFLIFR